MSIGDLVSIAGILGLIATLLIMAWQTHQLRQQTETANAIAHLGAHYNALERAHDINRLLLEHPELQPYFIQGQECLPSDPHSASVKLIAEMMADVFDLGLELHRRIADPVHGHCWDFVILDALKQPALRDMLTSGAPWWPDLKLFFDHQPPEATGLGEPQHEKAVPGDGAIT